MSAAEDLGRTLAAPPVTARVRAGVVVEDGGALRVNVDGAHPNVLWPVGTFFAPGDAVRVLVTPDGCEVLPPVLAAPRPATGTVAGTAAGGVVPVTTTVGEVSARYTGTAPSIGTLVRLDWAGTQPWVWPGAVAATVTTTATVTAPAPPPAPSTTGTLRIPATSSATWAAHRAAWSTTTRDDVLQGSWGALTYRGYWFHGAAPRSLAGRTITACRLLLPARIPGMGAHSAAATLHLYVHTSTLRAGTEPDLVWGPWDVVIPPTHKATWVTAPVALAAALIANGGGLAISGSPYAGVRGVATDANSGRIDIDWSRT